MLGGLIHIRKCFLVPERGGQLSLSPQWKLFGGADHIR